MQLRVFNKGDNMKKLILITLILVLFIPIFAKTTNRAEYKFTNLANDEFMVYSSAVRKWINSTAPTFTDVIADSIYVRTINVPGATATGINMQGAYTNAAIDLSDVVLDHSGSSGPVMIRAGSYGSPVTSSDPHQSGMIRLYGSNDAATDVGTGFYDRGLFAYLRTDKAKGIYPIAGLAEVRTTTGDGPIEVMAGQFIAGLHTAGSKLATGGWGMYGLWAKVYAENGATAASGTKVAALWVDTDVDIALDAELYTIYALSSGLAPDAFIGFQDEAGYGWEQLLYFDETAYNIDPVSGKSLKVLLDDTQYYIPLSTSADDPTFANLITDSLYVNGGFAVVGSAHFADGSAGTPSINFTSDTDTGFYSGGANAINVAIGGNTRGFFADSGFSIHTANNYPKMAVVAGTTTNPGFIFNGDTNTGYGHSAEDQLSLITGGKETMRLGATGITQETYSIRKVVSQTGMVDNTATNVFTITTVTTEFGGYKCNMSIMAGDDMTTGNANTAVMGLDAHFVRVIENSGNTGTTSAVAEISQTASADEGSGAVSDITMTVVNTSETIQTIQAQVDVSASGVADIIIIIELIYWDLATAPVIAAS